MNIQTMLLTPNIYSRPQTALKKVTKIAVHYVGNAGSSAIGNRNYFESLKDKKTTYASSHYIVGLDGEIIMCVPENEVAYCTNEANSYSISIETCHPASDGKFNDKTRASLTELCADICKRYNLNPLTDIIRHYDVTGKKCPLYWVNNPNDFEKFKAEVKATMAVTISNVGDAIKRLVTIGVIGIPDFWHNAVKCVEFLDILLINSAKKVNADNQGNIKMFDDAIQKLVSSGIILTPAYWVKAIGVVKYLEGLIINIANKL